MTPLDLDAYGMKMEITRNNDWWRGHFMGPAWQIDGLIHDRINIPTSAVIGAIIVTAGDSHDDTV